MENQSAGQSLMDINYKGRQYKTETAVVLQEEDVD
jgi:hypothetical protein